MAGTTPNLALPYPDLTEPADVPADMQALAERLDIIAAGPLVTTLPPSPADGQEVYYVADAANGVVWHLRRNTTAGQWQVIGGAGPLWQHTDDPYTLATLGSWIGGEQITAPLAGTYQLRFNLEASSHVAAGGIGMQVYRGAGVTGPVIANSAAQIIWSAPDQTQFGGRSFRAPFNAGEIMALAYNSSTNGATIQSRIFEAFPIVLN